MGLGRFLAAQPEAEVLTHYTSRAAPSDKIQDTKPSMQSQ
jgi:hypothetical protein